MPPAEDEKLGKDLAISTAQPEKSVTITAWATNSLNTTTCWRDSADSHPFPNGLHKPGQKPGVREKQTRSIFAISTYPQGDRLFVRLINRSHKVYITLFILWNGDFFNTLLDVIVLQAQCATHCRMQIVGASRIGQFQNFFV